MELYDHGSICCPPFPPFGWLIEVRLLPHLYGHIGDRKPLKTQETIS